MRAWPPSQMEIQRVVAGNVEAWEFVYVSKAEILFKVFGQINGRLHKELMARALSIGSIGCGVLAALVFADIHLQIAVRTEKPPFWKNLPLDKRFHAVSSPAHFVAGYERIDNIRRSRASFHERSARFRRAKVGVRVIETGYIQG